MILISEGQKLIHNTVQCRATSLRPRYVLAHAAIYILYFLYIIPMQLLCAYIILSTVLKFHVGLNHGCTLKYLISITSAATFLVVLDEEYLTSHSVIDMSEVRWCTCQYGTVEKERISRISEQHVRKQVQCTTVMEAIHLVMNDSAKWRVLLQTLLVQVDNSTK